MGHIVYLVYSFLLQKVRLTFKQTKMLHYFTPGKTIKNPNLSELTQGFCGLLSLLSKYFLAKRKCIGAMLTIVSFEAVVWSCHTTSSIPCFRERTCCVTRPTYGCERDQAYCCSSNREKTKIVCLQLVAPKIEFHLVLLQKAN